MFKNTIMESLLLPVRGQESRVSSDHASHNLELVASPLHVSSMSLVSPIQSTIIQTTGDPPEYEGAEGHSEIPVPVKFPLRKGFQCTAYLPVQYARFRKPTPNSKQYINYCRV